ncbi:MAG: prepilin-type N-terminal cleavage/methylation domain-containing protein [Xanthomonadales bacterium]|nr:prepilin-type N-terminal cleavage/methylation domain-containing protein [Xanthomonadales bacterium]
MPMLKSPVVNLQNQRGFTLLEVLAAFVLFALSFATVMQVLTGSIRNTARSQEYTQATLWADSIMAEVGLGAPIESGGASGRFNDKYSYHLDISEYEMLIGEDSLVSEALPVQLYRVAVEVSWGESNNPATASFVTLKAVNSNKQ